MEIVDTLVALAVVKPLRKHCTGCGKQLWNPKQNKTGRCRKCIDAVRNPSLQEIAERCKEIRKGWTDVECYSRTVDKSDLAEYTVPRCKSLIGNVGIRVSRYSTGVDLHLPEVAS